MLNKISITNFLSFKDTVTIDLLAIDSQTDLKKNTFTKDKTKYHKVMGVFGYNASGKSNILKAVMFLRQFILNSAFTSVSTDKIPVQTFLLSKDLDNYSKFEIEIQIDGNQYVYGFVLNQDHIKEEYLHQKAYNKVLYKRIANKIAQKNKDFKELRQIQTLKNNALVLSLLAVNNTPVATAIVNEMKMIEVMLNADRGVLLDFTFNNFAHNDEDRQMIKDFVLQSDINIQDLKALERPVSAEDYANKVPPAFRNLVAGTPGNFFERQLTTVHTVFDDSGKSVGTADFNFFDESFGTQQFFALSGAIVNAIKEGKTIFIDELDSSLHSFLTKYIIKYFVSSKHNPKNARLFFTSHDTNILNRELLRRDEILFVEKDKFGQSQIFSLAELGERKDRNYEERYLEGRYGAIPFIRDLEEK